MFDELKEEQYYKEIVDFKKLVMLNNLKAGSHLPKKFFYLLQ